MTRRHASLFLVVGALLELRFHGHPTIRAHIAYIGPGAGFAFLGSFLTLVLSFLAGLLSIFLWPFRMLLRMARRKSVSSGAHIQKLIFLGLDGLDASLTEKFMAEGKLPNLARLREEGSYRRLRTTFPALSPVAWSTFATGVNPGKHNIFDFLNRGSAVVRAGVVVLCACAQLGARAAPGQVSYSTVSSIDRVAP